MSPPTHKPLPSPTHETPQEPCPAQAGTRRRRVRLSERLCPGWKHRELLQQSSFSRVPSAELLQPSSFSPPSCPGAAACVPQLFSRRETPVGSTEIPAAHVPRKEGARKRCWEAASPASAPCAVSFAALLFGWHPPGTPGSLLPCRSSTAAGQTLRPCKSGGGCSVLMGNMVTTCPLPYLD